MGLHGFSWNWLLTGSAFVTTRFSSTLYPRFQYGSLGFSYSKDGSPLLGMPSILGSRTHAMPSCKGTSNQENFSLKRCTMYIRGRFSSLFQNAGLHNLKRFFQSYHQVDINFYLTKNISLCCYGDLTFFYFFIFITLLNSTCHITLCKIIMWPRIGNKTIVILKTLRSRSKCCGRVPMEHDISYRERKRERESILI